MVFSFILRLVAGKDATEAFFSLHKYEILEKPQYQRLQIGVINEEKPFIHSRIPGELSNVPYAEPTWLTKGYHSPYYSDVRLHVVLVFDIWLTHS